MKPLLAVQDTDHFFSLYHVHSKLDGISNSSKRWKWPRRQKKKKKKGKKSSTWKVTSLGYPKWDRSTKSRSVVSGRFFKARWERKHDLAVPLAIVDLKTQVRKFPVHCFDKRVASQWLVAYIKALEQTGSIDPVCRAYRTPGIPVPTPFASPSLPRSLSLSLSASLYLSPSPFDAWWRAFTAGNRLYVPTPSARIH